MKKIIIAILASIILGLLSFATYIYGIKKINSIGQINNSIKEDFRSQIDAKNNEINTLKKEIDLFLQQKPNNKNNQQIINYLFDHLSMLVTEIKNPFNSDKNLYIFGENIGIQNGDIELLIDSNHLTGCGNRSTAGICIIKIGESYSNNSELGVYNFYNGLSKNDEIHFVDENTIIVKQERNEPNESYNNDNLNIYKHSIDIKSGDFEEIGPNKTLTGTLNKRN